MQVVLLPVGAKVMQVSHQFDDVENLIVKTRDDSTGLGRDIAYFKYVNRPWEGEFAIWQWEIDNKNITLKVYV